MHQRKLFKIAWLLVTLLLMVSLFSFASIVYAFSPDTDLRNADASFWSENADDYSGIPVALVEDEPLPTMSINDVTVVDDVGVADFTVPLSSPSSELVTVDYSTADGTATAGSDYTAASGTLIFPAGVTTGTISVPIVGDVNYSEFNETFSLNPPNPVNASISDDQGIGTIADTPLIRWEDNGHYYQPYFSDVDRNWYEAEQYALLASFHGVHGYLATINSIIEQYICNELRVNNGGGCWWIGLRRDHVASPWYWITGEPCTDFTWWYQDEGQDDEEFFAAMCTWDDNMGRWLSTGNGVTFYADGFVIEYPDPPPAADAGQDQWVTYGTMVTLDGGNSSDPDDDYPLTFSWNISSAPDGSTATLDDPDSVTPSFTPDLLGTYVITLVVDDTYGVSSDADQVIVTVEEPLPMLYINDASENEDVGAANFTVSLSSPSSFPVTVNYSTADGTATAGSDYTASSGTLAFAPSEIAQTISIEISEDLIYEGAEAFYVNLSDSINATISDGQGIGIIVDNDLPGYPVELSISSTAGGNVTTPGEGTFAYDEGTVVDLVATPNSGYRFVSWTGDVATIASVTATSTNITMAGNYSISADFAVTTGCFIATAAYGTPMAEEIQVLREFRDGYLLTNPLGQAFVDLYYRFGPPIAEFITEHPGLKPMVRGGLVPVLAMSALVVNTSPAEEIAILGLLVLVSVAVAVWAARRRGRGSEYA